MEVYYKRKIRMKEDKNNSFWPSYVDVMTTLFAVMLVLFVVTYGQFKAKESQLKLLVSEYRDIIDVYSQIDLIDKSNYYTYDSIYLKHTLTVDITYQDKEYNITNKLEYDLTDSIKANKKRDSIRQAGILVQKTIQNLEKIGKNSKNIKFLVVIEGQSSKIPFNRNDWQNNQTLSFLRASFLKKFWTDPVSNGGCGLFQNNSENDPNSKCEIIVAGSGEGGVPRYYYKGGYNPITDNPKEEKFKSFKDITETEYSNWKNIEQRNQRFLINIIPIIGNINVTKDKFKKISIN